MIPADFGLAVGDFEPIGHAVGHNRQSRQPHYSVGATTRPSLTAWP
jgi:hypothetical protein